MGIKGGKREEGREERGGGLKELVMLGLSPPKVKFLVMSLAKAQTLLLRFLVNLDARQQAAMHLHMSRCCVGLQLVVRLINLSVSGSVPLLHRLFT